MRKVIMAAAAAFVIGGIATGAVLSQAQPVPPGGPMDHGSPMERHGMGGWEHRHGPDGDAHGWMHHRGEMMRDFALIYHPADRQLTPADVQKVAEAFLLWNGNHTWKVIDVAATPTGPIGFSLATPDGSVVAKFTMDPHTGRLARLE
jgi:hypothetical protein